MFKRFSVVVAVVLSAALPSVALAGTTGGERPAYRVAVLPFDTSKVKDEVTHEWGAQVGDLLTGLLSAENGLQTVERAKMDEILKEQGLNLTGLTSGDDQIKIGKLVGAQFLVVGRIFPIDRDICIVAKVISVETSKMKAEVVQGPLAKDLAPLVKTLSGKVATILREQGPSLLPGAEADTDAVAAMQKALRALQGKANPKFLVSVPESHISAAQVVPDPAAATEFLVMLKLGRFDVIEEESAKKAISGWAQDFLKDSSTAVPKTGIGGADIVLVGEGISQFGARTGNLITCIARLEVQAVDMSTGKVLSVGRKTVRKADIAEVIAAKTALQEAASSMAVTLIPEAVAEWRKAHEKAEEGR